MDENVFLQLDENISLELLEKCIVSFQNFYAVHLCDEQFEPRTLIEDLCLASAAASDCIIVDVNRLMFMLKVRKHFVVISVHKRSQ